MARAVFQLTRQLTEALLLILLHTALVNILHAILLQAAVVPIIPGIMEAVRVRVLAPIAEVADLQLLATIVKV